MIIKTLMDDKYIKDDPVKPELSYVWRKDVGEIYYIGEDDNPDAIVCVAMTPYIPKNIRTITLSKRGLCAIPYTIWSYKPKSGRNLIFALRDIAIQNHWERLVTLSPPTDISHNFHIENGAFLLSDNNETRNYEYPLCSKMI